MASIFLLSLVWLAAHCPSSSPVQWYFALSKGCIDSDNPWSFFELDRATDNFLLQYRNGNHCSTRKYPAQLFKFSGLRFTLSCVSPIDVSFFRGTDLQPSSQIELAFKGNQMAKFRQTIEDM